MTPASRSRRLSPAACSPACVRPANARLPFRETSNKATGWIASEAGKAFSVQVKLTDESRSTTVVARLRVDGGFVTGTVFGTAPPYAHRQVSLEDSYSSASTVRKLFFSKMAMSDDDNAIRDAKLLADLGTLGVTVTRVTVLGLTGFRASSSAAPEQNLTVHERAKKLGGHRTIFGAEERVAPTNFTQVLDHDVQVEFEFRYRPKDVLQAMDMIPFARDEPTAAKRGLEPGLTESTNSPRAKKQRMSCKPNSSAVKKPKREHRDEEDIQTLKSRIRELQAKLRQKEGASPADDDTPIKREPEPINAGRFFAKGEVIDLTDD